MANAIPVRYEHCTWTQWVVSAHYIQRDGQRQLRPRAVNRSRQRSSKHNHMLLDYTCRTVATKERSLKHRIWILIGLNFLSILGLPWWLSDKESVCQCRRQGFNPWSRKIPHAVEQLSSCTTTTDLILSRAQEPQLLSTGAATTEAHVS